MYFKQPIVRPAELAAALSVSTVTLWNWRRKGILPEPISFGPRFIGWKNDVLNTWLANLNGAE
ncbi:AlpA family transcriptional regulator [Colwellia sp. BRX10-4]|jgi:predicted DNA-binding transcriptional regulator AlpA|uniref:helix-turn-helix transcriptional regulator n=1 Tax=Colwellia sp. BRX10-4 TaxID=2759843 RepID=UPI0015F60499|nr:AlpA family phage regulatory protein [Colwellia sp. BRX10-4]MBA6397671.1 AlpA family phage regulatory protein [Colwellia sp. BRX10-4]